MPPLLPGGSVEDPQKNGTLNIKVKMSIMHVLKRYLFALYCWNRVSQYGEAVLNVISPLTLKCIVMCPLVCFGGRGRQLRFLLSCCSGVMFHVCCFEAICPLLACCMARARYIRWLGVASYPATFSSELKSLQKLKCK